jgi:hypothetical protein
MGDILEWWRAISCVRAPICIILVAGLAFLLPHQTEDMLNAFDVFTTLAFHFTLALVAFSGWFWSRTLLAARFKVFDTPAARKALAARHRRPFNWIPRLTFLLSVLLGCGIAIRSSAWLEFVIILAWAVVLTMLLIHRQNICTLLGRSGRAGPPPKPPGHILTTPFRQLIDYAPISGWITIAAFIIGFLCFSLGLLYGVIPDIDLPLWSIYLLPGPSIGLMALALMIGPFCYLTCAADYLHGRLKVWERTKDYTWLKLLENPPVMILLALWIFATSSLFNLHAIRTADPRDQTTPADRPTLRAAFTSWATGCDAHPQSLHPVIVAISGGATRAGLWGLRVLASVDAAIPRGQPRIFAISSVSGGSLGAAAFLTTLANQPKGDPCAPLKSSEAILDREGKAIGGDSLGAALAGLFMVDLPHQLLPISHNRAGSDRAAALEHAFERLWQNSGQFSPYRLSFSTPYLSLFLDPQTKAQRPGLPLWFTNGTDVRSGLRIITAPITAEADWPFLQSEDALSLLGRDVVVSTAVNNSARFPVLEPAGTLMPLFSEKHAPSPARVVDGGYFNNSGLVSAIDLALWLQTKGRDALERLENRRIDVDPLIVFADADGEALQVEQIPRCPARPPAAVAPISGQTWGELAPILAVFNLRMGHGQTNLMQTVRELCGPAESSTASQDKPRQRFFHFYLTAMGTTEIPLNWVLSWPMKEYILHTAMQRAGNGSELDAFTSALRPGTPAQPNPQSQ